MKNHHYTIVLIVLFIQGIITGCNRNLLVPASPNIVIILADDLGYGDIHAYNSTSKIPTPNLDYLAKNGMQFMDAHAPSAVCTPTRYGLLTGRYCWRTDLKRGVLNGYSEPLIEKDRQTIASLLDSTGYITGIVGKWHLGLGFQKNDQGKIDFSEPIDHCPVDLGFNYSYIIPASLDYPPYVYIENRKVTEYPELMHEKTRFPAFTRSGEIQPSFKFEDAMDHLLEKAINFIEDHAGNDNPFLLYFPLTAPHKPLLPHSRFAGASKHSLYGDFIYQVDWTVGQILKTIDDEDITKNTIVIFTSDNGSYMFTYDDKRVDHIDSLQVQGFRTENHLANGTLRGTKADIYEGGHRVPFIMRWPGVIKHQSKSSNPICLTDIFATIADIANVKIDTNSANDSYSFLSILQGENHQYHRKPIIHHSAGGMFAIRDGNWKLILGNGSGGREYPRGKRFEKPYQLFNLEKDTTEEINRISAERDLSKKLEEKCLKMIQN